MATKRTVFLEIEIGGADKVVRTGEDIKEAIKATREELDKVERGSDAYQKLQKQLGALKEVQKQTRAETRDAGREFVIAADKGERSYRALNAELVNARRAFKELSQAQREGAEGQKLLRQIQALDTELKDIDATIGQFQRNVGNYESALNGLGSAASNVLSLVGGVAIGASIADNLAAGATAVRDITIEFRNLRGEVQRLTGATGDELDTFATRIDSIGTTFQQENSEILQAANALTEQLTGDFGQSLELIETGFLGGLDVSGQFLDVLKEYPTFFQEAGLSGEQLINVINSSVDQGVFSDKGIDAIKEASLSLRELTDPTLEALNAIGFTGEEIENIIGEQGIGAAIAAVSERLSGFSDDSREVGLVLADVFKGAGEDAGVGFIKTLSNLNDGIEGVVDVTNELTAAQIKQLTVNQRFAEVQNEVSKAFADLIGSSESFGTQIKTVLLEGLLAVVRTVTTFIEALKAIPEFLRENRAAIGTLAAGLFILNAELIASTTATLAKAAADKAAAVATRGAAVAQRLLNIALKANPIGLVITAVGALAIALNELYKRNEEVRASIDGLGAVAAEVFSIIKEAVGSFVSGFQSIISGDIVGGLKSIGEGFVKGNPIGIALTEGKRLGDAFRRGRDESLKKSAESDINFGGSTDGTFDGATEAAAKAGEDAGNEFADNLNKNATKGIKPVDLEAAITDKAAEGSIKAIKDEIQKLTSDLEGAAPSESASILESIINLERELEKAEEIRTNLREKITEDLFGESVEEQVEASILAIEADRLNQIQAIQENELLSVEEKEQRRREIEIQTEIEILEERKRLAKEGTNELLELEVELADKRAELEETTNENSVERQIANAERIREVRIQEAEERIQDVEDLERERQRIEAESQIQILRIRQALFAEGSAERLAIQNEIAEKEKELAKETAEYERGQIEETIAKRKALIDETLNGLSSIVGNVQGIQENRFDAEIAAVEERYNREIQLAEGNKDKQEQLRNELDAEREAIEKEQFQRAKKLQVAQVGIQTAQGIVNILAAPTVIPDPFGRIFKGVQIAFLLGQAASQVAAIQAATFAEKGIRIESKGSSSSDTGGNIGKQTGALHSDGGNYVVLNGQPVNIERDERIDVDETGAAVVVNRRSAAIFRKQLDAIEGKIFPGKRKILSNINSFKSLGIPFGQAGLIVPNTTGAASAAGQSSAPGSGSFQANVNLSEDQVNFLANRISQSVKEGAERGVATGSEKELRRRERQELVNKSIGKV